jgi:hypothetical protein
MVACFQSCSYSVIVYSKNGVPQPGLNNELGFYNGKELVVIDTVANLSLIENKAYLVPECSEGGFHSVEYKITFGAMLRNTLTFGKKQSIKVKYVCIKESNQ